MSNDLISRSALLDDFRNTITEQSDTMDWLNMIARQPTAHDVDKVVEQLSCANCEDCLLAEYCTASFGNGFMEKIREIIKAGGVNE